MARINVIPYRLLLFRRLPDENSMVQSFCCKLRLVVQQVYNKPK